MISKFFPKNNSRNTIFTFQSNNFHYFEVNLSDDDCNNSWWKRKIENFVTWFNLRHVGNGVYSFTLKLKENRAYALPLYVTDKLTRFCLLNWREVGATSMCQVASGRVWVRSIVTDVYTSSNRSAIVCVRTYVCIENHFCHFKLNIVLIFVVFLFVLPSNIWLATFPNTIQDWRIIVFFAACPTIKLTSKC